MGPAKLEKAAKLNIPMLTETDFMKLVNENLKKKMWAFLKLIKKGLILLYLLMGLIEVATEF
jgi:hypothetical protein